MVAESRTRLLEKIMLRQTVGTGSYPAAKEWILRSACP